MAATVKGTPNVALASSVTIPTHAIGDLIVLFVYNGGNTTAPTKPTATGTVPNWVSIDANTGANGNVSRSYYFAATATNTTSGTWTNGNGMAAVVLTGQAASPIGGHAESGSNTSSAPLPAVTMSVTDGTSALLEFSGGENITTWGSAPSGYTQLAQVASGSSHGICVSSKNVTTSDGAVTQTLTGPGTTRNNQIEILAVAAVATATLTGHGVLSATATAKFSVAANLPGHGVLTVTAKATKFTLTAALPGHGVLSATATAKFTEAAPLTGHGVLAAAAYVKFTEPAVLSGRGALAGAPYAKFTESVAFNGHGVLTASAKATEFIETATLTGHGVLTAQAGAKIHDGVLPWVLPIILGTLTATLPGRGVLAASAFVPTPAALPGHGVLSATVTAKFTVSAALAGHGALAATDGAYGGVHLAGHGALSATATARYSRSATLTGHGALTTAPNGAYGGVNLPGHGALSATATAKYLRAATLTGHGALSGDDKPTQIAALTGHGLLTAAVQPTLAATLTGHGALTATDRPKLPATLGGTGALSATSYAKYSRAAVLAGTGTLVGGNTRPVSLTGRGVLSADARLYQIQTQTDLTGHGALTAECHRVAHVLAGAGVLTATVVAVDVTVVSGQLEIVCTDDYLTLQSEDPYDLTGSFVFAECIQPPNVSDGSTEALLYVYEAPTAGDGYIVQIGYYGGNFVCDDNGGSGTTVTTRHSEPFDLNVHKWWRIREAAGTVYWDHSADSLNWTNAASRTIAEVTDLYVGFISGCSAEASTPGIALWDNFNVSAAPAALSGHGQLAATINVVSRPATLAGHGSLSTTLLVAPGAPLSGRGDLTAVADMYSIDRGCALAGHGQLAAVAVAITRPAELAGRGALHVVVQPTLPSELGGHGTLTATTARPTRSEALAGHGALTGTAVPDIPARPDLASRGALTGTAASVEFALPATLTGRGSLTATAAQISRPATLTGHGALTANCAQRLAVTLPGRGELTSTAALPARANLAGHGALTAAKATGPKTDTLYDAFSRKNLTKWSGWSTDLMSITWSATYDSSGGLTGGGGLNALIVVPPPAGRTNRVNVAARTADAGQPERSHNAGTNNRTVTASSGSRSSRVSGASRTASVRNGRSYTITR